MNQEQPGFFDKNTILAVALSFLVFFVWQNYMAKKYPDLNKEKPAIEKTVDSENIVKNTDATTAITSEQKTSITGQNKQVATSPAEVIKSYEFDNFKLEISSVGMGFRLISLNNYTDREDQPITHIATGSNLLSSTLNEQELYFTIVEQSPTVIVGTATVGENTVVKTFTIGEDRYFVDVVTKITSINKQPVQYSTSLSAKVIETSTSLLLPSYDNQEFFSVDGDGENREIIKFDAPIVESYNNVNIASLNSQYFALAFWNESQIFPTANASNSANIGKMKITYQTPAPVKEVEFKYGFYFGPKKFELLRQVDESLTYIVDYGFFGFIGRPLLATLKFLFGLFGNWGVAIILLTFILRMLLLPINMYSMKAMRKMQKIQPILKEIKEKYKADPQRINQETMALMKKEGANPLSGCLPMLAQIPIFFAFFQVLGKSIELYKAPFYFWIHDLSIKDPYYVFPVLVGVTFFLQQKVTPSPSMDATQKKVMQFVPLIFCVFMISMPSGLTLYMFVNSLFAIGQQYIFMRERTT